MGGTGNNLPHRSHNTGGGGSRCPGSLSRPEGFGPGPMRKALAERSPRSGLPTQGLSSGGVTMSLGKDRVLAGFNQTATSGSRIKSRRTPQQTSRLRE
jgi:hypothetical protein